MRRLSAILAGLWILGAANAPLGGTVMAAGAPATKIAQAAQQPVQQKGSSGTEPAPVQRFSRAGAGAWTRWFGLGPADPRVLVEFVALLFVVLTMAAVRARGYLANLPVPPRRSGGMSVAIYVLVQGALFWVLVFSVRQYWLISALLDLSVEQARAVPPLGDRDILFGFLLWYAFDHLPLLRRVNEALLRLSAGRRGGPPETAPEAPEKSHPPAGPEPQALRRRSIADRLVSDRPLREGDPDPLGHGALARGISRFLRNEQTQAPLTLAVTGAWGTGKSSIMSLLQADLRRRGYRPVWFNAWHHQQEAHLLAALLETLRIGAFPAWWTPEGIAFRTRLFAIRARRRPGIFVVIGALIALQLGLILSGAAPDANALSSLVSGGADEAQALEAATALPGIGALLAVLLTAQVRLRNTLLDPARLTASVGRLAGVGRFRDRLSFRHRFGAEFRDVVEALRPRSLVILIDDLDRCRPDSVLEVLEAVNFLVSSGECIVVMGLDRSRVVDCVAYSFKDVAAYVEAGDPEPGAKSGAQRRAFAENYLEKLVNIEVTVPALPPEAAVALLREEVPDAPAGAARGPRARRGARAGPLWAVAGIVVIGGLAYGLGALLAGGGTLTGAAGAGGTAVARGAGSDPWLSAVLGTALVAVLLFEAGRWLVRRRRARLLAVGDVLEDSDDFTDALEDWYPLMGTTLRTPRALKRFVNRLRFLAMLGRGEEGGGEPEIDEATFVALAAVERCERHGLDVLDDGRGASPGPEYREASARHGKRHGNGAWPPSEAVVRRFRRISGGIVTREEDSPEPPGEAIATDGETP